MFILGHCPHCGTRHAVRPDPTTERGDSWFVYLYESLFQPQCHPTHVCSGGIFCIQGHDLEFDGFEGAVTGSGGVLLLKPFEPKSVFYGN